MNKEISKEVDTWMEEESHHGMLVLKVVRRDDPWQGMNEDEIQDAREFIRCYLLKDFEILLMIPTPPRQDDFWFSTHQEFMESAFNTYDFQKDRKPFGKYGYRFKKVLEQVKDLAIMHSCISQPEGRDNIKARFELLAKSEFTEPLLSTIEKYDLASDEERMFELKRKISKLSQHIMECKRIWDKYSPWEDSSSSYIPISLVQDCQASSPEQEEVFQHKKRYEVV